MPPLQLDKYKLSSERHLLADYTELLCQTNPDGLVTSADIQQRLPPSYAVTVDPTATADMLSQDNSVSDKIELVAADVFRHLQARQGLLGTSYPFTVTAQAIRVRRRLSARAHLYLFLLFASSLSCFSKTVQQRITADFEVIAADAAEKYLGREWTFRRFGTIKRSPDFNGSLYARLTQLSAALNERLIAKAASYVGRRGGDDGIDFVAWIPFADRSPSQLIALGQATCLADWPEKQAEVGADRIHARFHFLAPHIPFLCIPYSLRSAGVDWAREVDIHHTVLLDRQRILEAIGSSASGLAQLVEPYYKAALDWREPALP